MPESLHIPMAGLLSAFLSVTVNLGLCSRQYLACERHEALQAVHALEIRAPLGRELTFHAPPISRAEDGRKFLHARVSRSTF